MIPKDKFTRKQAARYLTEHYFEIAPQTLANLVVRGGGPPFTRNGWTSVTYDRSDLDAWARRRQTRVEARQSALA